MYTASGPGIITGTGTASGSDSGSDSEPDSPEPLPVRLNDCPEPGPPSLRLTRTEPCFYVCVTRTSPPPAPRPPLEGSKSQLIESDSRKPLPHAGGTSTTVEFSAPAGGALTASGTADSESADWPGPAGHCQWQELELETPNASATGSGASDASQCSAGVHAVRLASVTGTLSGSVSDPAALAKSASY